MSKPLRALCFTATCVGAGAIAACAALEARPVPTLPLLHVASNAEDLRGKVIRTCGPIYQQFSDSSEKVWELVQPQAVGHHPATVLVVRCSDVAPVPVTTGKCMTGRVAARDGSLRKPAFGSVMRSAPSSEPWYVHEQCPFRRR